VENPDFKLIPARLFRNDPAKLQQYESHLTPLQALEFTSSEATFLAAMASCQAPTDKFIPAMHRLPPSVLLGLAPQLLALIPRQPSKPQRMHLLCTLFSLLDLQKESFLLMLFSAEMIWFVQIWNSLKVNAEEAQVPEAASYRYELAVALLLAKQKHS
jgi:hypothetical protein